MPAASALGRHRHQVHRNHAGGLNYWVLIDHQLGMYGAYRAPLTEETAA